MHKTVSQKETDVKLKMLWPVEKIKEANCYFYNIPIEKYVSSTVVKVKGKGEMIMFGGYSYLSLHKNKKIELNALRALKKFGSGGHGVRLLAGTTSIHRELEERISRFKGTEDAVTYSSGYVANISSISSLVGRHDTIISDRLNHASIVDGCLLSRATFRKFRHNDMKHLETLLKQNNPGRVLVIADAVFSMDGDIFDLPKAAWLCKEYNALLMVDESHSIGVIGKTGKGIEEHFGLPKNSVDIKMGTLSKAIPSQGGYIASSKKVCNFLRHQSRGFIYSGANTPTNDAASTAALDIIMEEPERVAKLHENVAYAKAKLKASGFDTLNSDTAILPVVCGADWAALELAKHCHDHNIYIQAIPYPVVPKGKARLRLSINTDHTKEQIDYLAEVLKSAKISNNESF